MLKINEQIRGMENSLEYLVYEVEKLEKEVERKEGVLKNREENTMSLEKIK